MAEILIYTMNYAPEAVGAGRVTAEIGAYLEAEGHDVTVVTTPPHYPEWRLRPPERPYRWRKERWGRQTIYRCPLRLSQTMSGVNRLLAPLSFAINSAPVVAWRILRRQPEAVLCVEPTLLAAPVALLAAKLVGARTVLHVQDLEVDAAYAVGHLTKLSWLKPLAYGFERTVLRRFDELVTISSSMAARLATKGVVRERIALVRNGVDLARIRPLAHPSPYRRELGIADGERVVLYSGSLTAKADFGAVLGAVEALAARRDVKFVIAGAGPLKSAIEAKAATLPNLISLPLQPESRMAEFLALADLHLLPQAAGTADLVLPSKLGAMLASGRAILATAERRSEIGAFLGDAASLTPPGDAAALARAIVEALDGEAATAAQVARRLALAARLSKRDSLRAMEALLTARKPAFRADLAEAG